MRATACPPHSCADEVTPGHSKGQDGAGWWLYLIECGDGSWYAGISTDVAARLSAHAAGKGARYTRGRGPIRLLAQRAYPDRAAASRAEWQLKRLPRQRKRAFFDA